MHERERHTLILDAVADRPVLTVSEAAALTGASEATTRRDIAALHLEGKLRRVRGGAEAVGPRQPGGSTVPGGIRIPSFAQSMNVATDAKRAIADRAVAMCEDGEAIIVNGGTTTYHMVHALAGRRLSVMTNSFPIAEVLLRTSRCTVTIPGGTVYRDQQVILSPFDEDATQTFAAKRMFMGAQGLGPLGVMEVDPVLVRAEQKLIGQAEELIVMLASNKLTRRAPLICCPLARVHTVITDSGIGAPEREMLEGAGVRLEIVEVDASSGEVAA